MNAIKQKMIRFSLHFPNVANNLCDKLFLGVQNERNTQKSGYYELPFSDSSINEARKYIDKHKDFLATLSHLVIIGIGGSSLGIKAINGMLEHLPSRNSLKLRFLEHTDPIDIHKSLKGVKRENTLFIVISKSGTTIETTSLLKYVLKKFALLENADSKRHLLVITDFHSPLEDLAKRENLYHFGILPSVGGRFSILSIVGILPLHILGFDTHAILQGASTIIKRFFERKEEHILHKAITYANAYRQIPMNVLFSYSSLFAQFNAWYVQLWGESLGKINAKGKSVGLTPIALIGSIDQHSFLQLIVQGVRDKSLTFLSLHPKYSPKPRIPNMQLIGLESTNFVNGSAFSMLLHKQHIATMQTVQNEGILTDSIEIMDLCEASVGALIAYFELLTSCVGYLFQINTYDQPGVELGKARLKELFNL